MSTMTIAERAEALAAQALELDAIVEQKKAELDEAAKLRYAKYVELHKARSEERLYTSTEARFKRAIKAIRAEGIIWKSNVRQCCRGCVSHTQLGLASTDSTEPYAWTFGGQGHAIRWDENGDVRKSDKGWRSETFTYAYINWGNGSAQKVADAFRAEGFEVEWDGTDSDTVTVTL